MLGRVARRRQEELVNREKTLEPDRSYMNPVTRSATTMLNGDRAIHAYQKERTPYKLTRQRQKYTAAAEPTAIDKLDTTSRRSRALAGSTSDYDPIRRKDTLYDAYAPRSDRPQYRYGDHSVRSKAVTKDLSYYDGGADKENHYKSKYDPAKLYADAANNNTGEADDTFDTSQAISERDRERKRALRSYKRTCTANDRRHTTNYKDVLTQLDDERPSASRFAHRQSSGAYQRSQTQKFFDGESEASALEQPVVSEREARRKEIQGLIMKYAQLDDVYNKATEDRANNNKSVAPNGVYGAGLAHLHGSSSLASIHGAGSHLGSSIRGDPEMVALSKTQSVASMSSLRSRIPKALTTFVRLNLALPTRPKSVCVLFDFTHLLFLSKFSVCFACSLVGCILKRKL